MPELFSARGIPFDDIPCYDTVYESPDAGAVLPLLEGETWVTFTSASTVRGFVQSLPGADLSHVLGLCIGEQTAREARTHGLTVRVAREATMESLVELIRETGAGE